MKKLLSLAAMAILCSEISSAQTALQFTATVPNYVEVGNAMNTVFAGTNRVTVEAWCYLNSYSFLPTLVGNYGTGLQFLLRVDGNRVAFWVDNGGFSVINGNTTVPLNTWTHLAGVWDGSTLTVYFNGVPDGSRSLAAGTFMTHNSPLRIGANQLSEPWDGKLDDVRIWTTARTELEILTSMNGCLSATTPGLLALYDFEEGAGVSLADRTGHGYNGTLVNSPVWTSGTGCVALPVNYVSINARKSDGDVLLSWKVSAESNILRYEVERSSNGTSFELAGTIIANLGREYSWRDISPSSMKMYYRVKSIALSGEIKYSAIAYITRDNELSRISISPNPVQGHELNLQFKNKQEGTYTVRLMDASGRLQLVDALKHPGGNSTHTIRIPLTARSGLYRLMLTDAEKQVTTQQVYIQRPD